MIETSLSVKNGFISIRKHLKRGGFIRNIGTLLAGNIVAQSIGLLASPIITRLYIPQHFGEMAFVSAIIETIAIVACLRYENAIVLPKRNNSALHIISLCLLVAFSLSILSSILLLFLKHPIAKLAHIENMENYLWAVPFGILLSGIYRSLDYWNTRLKNFHLSAISKIIQPTTANIVKLAAGFIFGSTALWLIIGNISGIFFSAIALSILFLKSNRKQFFANLSIKRMIVKAREFQDFPRYNSLKNLMNSFAQKLPVFLFAHFFSVETVAYYSLARISLAKPITMITETCGKVLLQKASELNSKGHNLRNYIKKSTIGLSLIGLIPFGIMAVKGEWIFSIIFGSKYSMAGYYAQFLTLWLFFLFINTPAKQVILIKQKLQFDLYFNIVFLIARVGAIVVPSFISSDPLLPIICFSITGALGNLFLIIYAFSVA